MDASPLATWLGECHDFRSIPISSIHISSWHADDMTRKRLHHPQEPFILNVAGQRLVVLISPSHVTEVFKNATTFTFDSTVQTIHKGVATVSPEGYETLWRTPSEGYDSLHGNPNNKVLAYRGNDILHDQVLPGQNLEDLTQTFLGHLEASTRHETITKKCVLATDCHVSKKVVSLQAWCMNTLIDVASRSVFGDYLLEVEPSLPEIFQSWDENSWMITYQYPAFLASAATKPRDRLIQAFTHYLETPREERGKTGYFVNEEEDEERHAGLSTKDSAKLMMIISWAWVRIPWTRVFSRPTHTPRRVDQTLSHAFAPCCQTPTSREPTNVTITYMLYLLRNTCLSPFFMILALLTKRYPKLTSFVPLICGKMAGQFLQLRASASSKSLAQLHRANDHSKSVNANAHKAAFWLLAHVLSSQSLLSSIRAETAGAISPTPTTFDMANEPIKIDHHYLLDSCPHLNSAFNETLRLTSTPANVREVVAPATIGGKTLTPGIKVLIPQRQLLMDEQGFGSTAQDADLDRFFNDKTLEKSGFYRPFGGGTTLCSGRFLARREVLAFVAILLWRYDIDMVGEGEQLLGVRGKPFPKLNLGKPSLGIASPMPGDDVVIAIQPRRLQG